ncbi:Flap endonuclease 1-A [Nosema bombycis CQ1]|uniref:Flap endonuclease 1-A n=1 Tax=Nosema bombycis (strain CQ1 / CVCC 102059) TaxID=578461 RepID=R0MJA6_NOSB1|nr:Flap endonuclease 1-A [Nosema bombycis CQ1]|eukprot:EOB14295.1 Flap endonuclease 1-A [Nosema bombycis CQ1]
MHYFLPFYHIPPHLYPPPYLPLSTTPFTSPPLPPSFFQMGIKQLTKLIKENSKKGIVERPLSFYSDKKVAIDASMFIYQFLIAVRNEGTALGTDDNVTSHLVGLFYRTINM